MHNRVVYFLNFFVNESKNTLHCMSYTARMFFNYSLRTSKNLCTLTLFIYAYSVE